MQGILSPPHDSPPSLNHSARASPRHSPAPTKVADPAKRDDDAKRRRRHKQNNAESPLKHSASLNSSSSSSSPDEPAPGVAAADAASTTEASNATPTRSARRRRGKATRQPSPPPHDGTLEHPAPVFPSTTPPQTDLGALAHHSRSVPPDPFLQAPRFDAAWDMPAVAAGGGADSPKQSLSWQQELLKSGAASGATTGRTPRGDSPVSRPRSRGVAARDSRPGGAPAVPSAAAAAGKAPRPALHSSHSETGTTGAGPSLNWQQELLLQMDPAAVGQQQIQQQQQQQSQLGAPAGITPARQRRNQLKDSITFGLGTLDLSEDDTDVFASPGSRRSGRTATQAASSSSSFKAVTGLSTPTRPQQLAAPVVAPVEPRYAGPTFHNSPAPSSLPVPSFMLRRKVDVAV